MSITSELKLKMINYFENDAKRINHAIKVHGFAKTIAEEEGLENENLLVVEATAILHDIGIKISEQLYSSSSGKYQELEGPPIAKEILKSLNFSENIINRICYIIGNHHTYNKIDALDFQVLVEADFLVNIFEDEMNMQQIKSIKEKYFKTKTGTSLMDSIYSK